MSRLSKKQFVFLNFTLNPSYNMLNSFEDSLKQGPATLLAWCYMKPKQEGELPFGIIPAQTSEIILKLFWRTQNHFLSLLIWNLKVLNSMILPPASNGLKSNQLFIIRYRTLIEMNGVSIRLDIPSLHIHQMRKIMNVRKLSISR